MSNQFLPDIDSAKAASFEFIAKAINAFFDELKKTGEAVSREDIELVQNLINILTDKAPELPPDPGPKPIPPRPPHGIKRNKHEVWRQYERDKRNWIETVLAPWQEASNNHVRVLKTVEHRIIKGRRKEIEQLTQLGRWPRIREVNWEILPPGHWPIDESSISYIFAGKSEKKRIDERLFEASKLNPIEIIMGKNEFNEYLCYRYRNTDKILLESPYEGNAAYILEGNWELLSRKTKYELLNIYAEFCERIIHGQSGNWKYEIKRSLRLLI